MEISEALRQTLLIYQRTEITEHHIYARIAKTIKHEGNRRVLERISQDELRHYRAWKAYTHEDVKPNAWSLLKYTWLSRTLGFTFAVKLMERGEEAAQVNYGQVAAAVPAAEALRREEEQHEEALLALLDEERLRYTGSMVLGLNDALVELTGVLAGLTLALQDTRLIALTGSITGIAAALSMAASEYLSTKTEAAGNSPLKAALYTGSAYVITVILLILPYLLFSSYYLCLALTLLGALAIVALFNYYISVAKDEPFRRRFLEMAGLSLSVAAFSFLVGLVLRTVFGIEV